MCQIITELVFLACSSTTDNTMPAPKDLIAAASVNGNSPIVTLTWTPEQNADYYEIRRTTDSKWKTSIVLESSFTRTVYTDSYNLKAGSKYYYKVGAKEKYSTDTVENFSRSASIEILLSGITGLYSETISDSSIKITWNNYNGASQYRIYRSNSSGDYGIPIADIDAIFTEYTDTLLKPGTTYYYRIAIIDNDGIEEPSTNYSWATTRIIPVANLPPPENLNAKSIGQVILLKWDEVEWASTYYVFIAFEEEGPYTLLTSVSAAICSEYMVSRLSESINLSANTAYYFKVSAGGERSNSVMAITES